MTQQFCVGRHKLWQVIWKPKDIRGDNDKQEDINNTIHKNKANNFAYKRNI